MARRSVPPPSAHPDAEWSRPAEAVLAALGASRDGLSPSAAAERLRRTGPNIVRDEGHQGVLGLALRQVQNPLVLILVFAALIAGVMQEWLEAAIILSIVLGSSALGFTQEYRASNAVAQLRQRLSLMAKVRRGGQALAVPFSEIVPGDIVLLSAGAIVPADAIVLEAQDLLVSEAALTGESFPVEKRPGLAAADAPLAERTNMVFLGASVRSGMAEVLVIRTGQATQYGAIAERLKTKPVETDFARGVRQFGGLLIRVMVAVVIFVLVVNQLLGRPFIESLLFAVALGVGLSPELLPAIISVTLAAGARDLAKRGVLVRQLDAIENLGGMTVFCTDKTGTLTEGQIVLEAATDPQGQASPEVARLAFLNAAFETGIANPLDEALMAAGAAAGLDTAGWLKVDEIPYDFTRKRLTIVVQAPAAPQARLLITKGAFSNVLDLCVTWRDGDRETPLTAAARTRLEAYFQARGEEGFRVLALATRSMEVRPDYVLADESEMCFQGFLVFMDPPKPEAAAAIAALAALGVSVKVLSGDNRHVVGHVARSLGLDTDTLLTGAQVAALKDEALWNLAQRTTVFAEVDPQQKERIVRALQRMGHCVGYLGDGINDAPSLFTADVGVSVEGAVDVARQSADVVLTRRDLGVLRDGVVGGRRTFANTLKYICITTSANFGNMVSMALAAPFLPFLPMAASQILLNNFLSDLPSIAISTDAVEASQLGSAQRLGVADIRRFMIVFGLVSSAFDLLTFAVLLRLFRAHEATFQTAWFVVSLLTELAVVMVLRTRLPAWRSRPGTLLAATTAGVAILAMATPYLGKLSALFGLTPLSAALMATLVAIVLAYIAATEAVKLWFFRPQT
ncbi:magnesium-translocating P-type ATPase [Phenylobacterium sp.]|uniref:magnesium-translocating P-type ATPase n=1 Tax=Phenylobacterium sp. TaxID=1871053 RepID=UPI003BAA7BAD